MKHKNLKIGIVGAGAWGKAIAKIYYTFEITIFSRRDESTPISALSFVNFLFVTLNAQDVEKFFETNKFTTNIILCSKGINLNSGELLYKIIERTNPLSKIFVLSGPNFAHEIGNGLPAISSLAGQDLNNTKEIATILSTQDFKLIPTDDLITVSLAGSLKNVLAILCGVIRGLKLGENFIAAAINKGIKEISDLSLKLGGKLESIFEPAFIGDIFLTCNTITSRNVQYGINLIKSASKVDYIPEGLHTALSFKKFHAHAITPLLNLTVDIIASNLSREVIKQKIIFCVLGY